MKAKFNTLKAGLGNGLIYERIEYKNERHQEVTPYLLLPDGEIDNCLPVLFSLAQLTKTIRVEGFNDGVEFVPALELARIAVEKGYFKDNAPTIPFDYSIKNKEFGKVLKVTKIDTWVIYLSLSDLGRAKKWIVDLLELWHFNTENLPESDYIDASESKVYEPKY